MTSDQLRKRLWQSIARQGDCWVWTGRKSWNGYGRVYYKGKERVVHRLMYMLYGEVIVDDEQVDHLCRNRACCNPAHLEAVSPKKNTRRGKAGSGPRDARGRFARCPRR